MSVYIVGAKRTAFAAFGGSFKGLSATQLATHASKAALAHANVNPEIVDTVVMGNVQQTAADASYLARHVGLNSGVPVPTPALTVNRLCGSGFQAVISGAQDILTGHASVGLVGGTENMSQAPHAVYSMRWGQKFGTDPKFLDTLWAGLSDSYCNLPMGITAENLAEQYGLTLEDTNAFAVLSQQRYAQAKANGVFANEIAPVEIKSRKGTKSISEDEHPRPQTDMASMAKLPAPFKKNGTVNAGNASGICDGAAALVIAGEEAIKAHGLNPLVKVVAWESSGVDPSIMGIGPVPAIRGVLKRSGLSIEDIDLFEVNEAFAPQFLAVEKELGLPREKTNVNGGAIAIGHPLGASGARITGHLVHELVRTGGRYAIGSACIGGGQGIAILLENVSKKN
eukprot:TRINITY_DN12709_c0_g1_i1.p1 TRINITY_DN12709_c0_g1~~TRINITY_DN12709_c0_g1_i1.p1  ORF type:complete len:412 (+),score=103.41 TRINITY_DN12709_c0_g1_i1:48-1238(+)